MRTTVRLPICLRLSPFATASCSIALLLSLQAPIALRAQQTSAPQTKDQPDTQQSDDDQDKDATVPSPSSAWALLEDAAGNAKRPQIRIQAIAALGTIGSNPRSVELIRMAMKDPDLDVRTAAILAAAATRNKSLLNSTSTPTAPGRAKK